MRTPYGAKAWPWTLCKDRLRPRLPARKRQRSRTGRSWKIRRTCRNLVKMARGAWSAVPGTIRPSPQTRCPLTRNASIRPPPGSPQVTCCSKTRKAQRIHRCLRSGLHPYHQRCKQAFVWEIKAMSLEDTGRREEALQADDNITGLEPRMQ